jgi:hypothetical protein
VHDDGSGPALYMTGNRMGVVRWDGTEWAALGEPFGTGGSGSRWGRALAVFDDGGGPALYLGGNFINFGGAAYAARWDGASWSGLGAGTNGIVWALAVYDDGSGPALYAGGQFTSAGGSSSPGIARWDGTNWSSVGGGTNLVVRALTVFDDGSGAKLYAAGNFTTAGGVPANRVACWNGTSWSTLGSGADGEVWCLAVHDDGAGPALYAGGDFTTVGGVGASRVARWDGTSWSSLGSGVTGVLGEVEVARVSALAVFDDGTGPTLFVGGEFLQAGGLEGAYLAKWGGCASTVFPAFCDASDGALAACPCGNQGAPDTGCDLPQGTGGVRLDVVAQTTSPNGATLTGTGFNVAGSPVAVVIRSTSLDAGGPVAFGDGVRCVSTSPLVRLAASPALAGTSTHAFGHGAGAGPGTFFYQLWFRSNPSTYCDAGAAFNLSSGRTLSW